MCTAPAPFPCSCSPIAAHDPAWSGRLAARSSRGGARACPRPISFSPVATGSLDERPRRPEGGWGDRKPHHDGSGRVVAITAAHRAQSALFFSQNPAIGDRCSTGLSRFRSRRGGERPTAGPTILGLSPAAPLKRQASKQEPLLEAHPRTSSIPCGAWGITPEKSTLSEQGSLLCRSLFFVS